MDNLKRAEAYHKSRLGQILMTRGYVTEEQLKNAVQQQQTTGQKIGEVLLEQKQISRWQLRRALSNQTRLRFAASLAVALLSPVQALTSESDGEGGGKVSENSDAKVERQSQYNRVTNNRNNNEADTVNQGANQLVHLILPVIESLPSGASIKTLSYDPNQARAEIRMNGSVRLRLPSSLGELFFENIRLKGSASREFDQLNVDDIDLTAAKVSIRSIYKS